MSSTSTVRALVLEKPRSLVARRFPWPDIGDDDGLLRVEACGLCGTDHEQFTGALPGGFAFVPGHETVGVVVDVTAKAPGALAQAIGLARPGGTVVLAGTRGSADSPGFWPDLIVYKELRILGALGVDAPAYRSAIELLASGRLPFAELPRRCQPLEGAEQLLRAMAGEGDEPAPVHGVLVS